MTADPREALARLSDAFRARDVAAALECFVGDDEVSYTGSELGERAVGRAALVALLGRVFTREEAYSWRTGETVVTVRDGVAHVAAEATGYAHQDDGGSDEFPYRLSGLLELAPTGWLWRACQASEPTQPA